MRISPEPTPYDVIIVLGAAQRDDGRPGPAMQRRVTEAVRQLRAGAAPLVLFSGGLTRATVPECESMAELARALGVDDSQILCEDRSSRTLENADYCADLLAQRDLRRCLLVTDGFHMARALMTFRAFGVRVEPAPVTAPWTVYTLASYLREAAARRLYPKRIETHLKRKAEASHARDR